VKLDTARPKRQHVLVFVLFVHGLVFLGGFTALGIGATVASLGRTSEQNRLHRAPDAGEAAAGEIWFSGHIDSLLPGLSATGERNRNDPWKGCSIRRQSYHSGKNAGWYDSSLVYAYGSVSIVSDEPGTKGRHLEVAIHALGPGARTTISDDEAVAMMPEAPIGGSGYRWVRDCFSTGWGVTVDGRDKGGMLEPIFDRTMFRVETRDARVDRLHSEAMWCSLGPLAFAGALAWLGIFLSVVRMPGHVPNMFGAAFGKSLPGSSLAMAMPLVGLALGVISRVWLFHSMAPLYVYVVAFSSFGLLIWNQARSFALRRRVLSVLTGVEVFGISAMWGKLAPPPNGDRNEEPIDVTATEVFAVGGKGALGNKVHTHVEPDPFFIKGDNDVTSTCDGASSNFYGRCNQDYEGGHDVQQSPYGTPALTNNRYAVRVTRLGKGDDLVIVGPSAKGADSRAAALDHHEGYRESGSARFFRADGKARVVVFQGTRDELRARVDKDFGTLRIYRVLLMLWFVFALSTLALGARYMLFS